VTVSPFADRREAGRLLARRLDALRGQDVVILGLPRGGVPVAYEVALALEAPLDVIVVRKLGVPYQPEVAMGAIGEGGFGVIDEELIARAGVSRTDLQRVIDHERAVLDVRVARLRMGRDRVDVRGRTVVIIDDGLATGATARVACRVARHLGATRVIVAVPVAPADTQLPEADELVTVASPQVFQAVGLHYRDFAPTDDAEVIELLRESGPPALPSGGVDTDVVIPADGTMLDGHLRIPPHPHGVVVFAHGSGSSRHSPRNQFVAMVLHQAGIATVLLDLLSTREEQHRSNVFNVRLLGDRLGAAIRWARKHPDLRGLPVGLFGASTGAAAALIAAADDADIAAVVSRGGRPDLAGPSLRRVTAPTLLIVGGADTAVLQLNREAQAQMRGPTQITVIPGAGHLFEEPGTLAAAAHRARDWFVEHMAGSGGRRHRAEVG
jgi:putative phosphoribosyl transferase